MAAVQKVALITAGSAGLGAQIARVFAPDFRLIINYSSNKERADSLVEELTKIPCSHPSPASPRFLAIQADASKKASLEGLVDDVVKSMGRLDVVVSNHGWTRMTNFMKLEENVVEEDWDKCFDFNVKSHLFLAHAAKKHLEETEGAFISTASVAAVKPSGSSVAYSVTKAAQVHLIKALAVSCAPKIRVNSVSPGLLLTEWGMKFPEDKREAARNNSRLKRLASLEDVAQQVKTLALSQSTTGQNIVIDSGITV